jgi:hypothetical protein
MLSPGYTIRKVKTKRKHWIIVYVNRKVYIIKDKKKGRGAPPTLKYFFPVSYVTILGPRDWGGVKGQN